METFQSIQDWGHSTFGVPSLGRCVKRAYEEWVELEDDVANGRDPEAVVEVADVIITLLNIPGVPEAIEGKMKINRARQWNTNGDGTGYHIKEA